MACPDALLHRQLCGRTGCAIPSYFCAFHAEWQRDSETCRAKACEGAESSFSWEDSQQTQIRIRKGQKQHSSTRHNDTSITIISRHAEHRTLPSLHPRTQLTSHTFMECETRLQLGVDRRQDVLWVMHGNAANAANLKLVSTQMSVSSSL